MSPGCEHDGAVGAALVRERVDVPGAPMVEVAALVGVAPLRHHRILAAASSVRSVPASLCTRTLAGLAVDRLGVLARLLEPGRRHQLRQLVGRVDDHQHARAAVHHRLQPLAEQRHVEDHDQVGRARPPRACPCTGRSSARRPRVQPGQRVDAQLVDVGAELLGGGEGRLDVLAAGARGRTRSRSSRPASPRRA